MGDIAILGGSESGWGVEAAARGGPEVVVVAVLMQLVESPIGLWSAKLPCHVIHSGCTGVTGSITARRDVFISLYFPPGPKAYLRRVCSDTSYLTASSNLITMLWTTVDLVACLITRGSYCVPY